MPTYPNYLSPSSGYGSYYSGPTGYSPNMNDPQYNPNYSIGDPTQGGVYAENARRQKQGEDIALIMRTGTGGIDPMGWNYKGGVASLLAKDYMSGGGGGGSSSGGGGGGGGGGSASANAALDRRFQMDLERMKLAQMDAQNKWNARMQGFGSDLSLRNNLYGIAAQQPSSQQVGNALQIIGGDSARAFQPPVNPIGPAKGAVDYWPGGTPPAQPPPYIRRG